MRSFRHGYSVSYRAIGSSSCRTVTKTAPPHAYSTSVQHGLSKGKSKAADGENALEPPGPSSDRSTDLNRIKSQSPSHSSISWVQGLRPPLHACQTAITAKEGKLRRRKRWRPQDSYSPSEDLNKELSFHRQYLSRPRLLPLVTTITEVIEPAYRQLSKPWRSSGVRPKNMSANQKAVITQPEKPPTSRGRTSRPSNSSTSTAHLYGNSHIALTPLPLSSGYGDVEQRANRCRQATQQRDRSVQDVLKGLGGNHEEDRDGEEQGYVGDRAITSHTLRLGPDAHTHLGILHQACRNSPTYTSIRISRKYSSYTSTVACQTPESPLVNPPADFSPEPPSESAYEDPKVPEETPVEDKHSSRPSIPDSDNLSGFHGEWKGEQWKGDEWRDAWNADNVTFSKPLTKSDLRHYGHWSSRIKRRPTRFSSKRYNLSPLVGSNLPSVIVRGLRKRSNDTDVPETTDESELNSASCFEGRLSRYARLHPPRHVRISQTAGSPSGSGSNEALIPMSSVDLEHMRSKATSLLGRLTALADETMMKNVAQTIWLDSPLRERKGKRCELTEPRDMSGLRTLAATRIITGAAQALGSLKSQVEPCRTSVTSSLNPELANPGEAVGASTPTGKTSSRKALKLLTIAQKAKGKRQFLEKRRGGLLPILELMVKTPKKVTVARSLDRKASTAKRKQKKPLAPKSVVANELKPLTTGENVLVDVACPREQRSVSRLAHGLDRVLFSQSVHWLQDPHSRVFNFSPTLQDLPPVTDFAFERLPSYVSSSQDEALHTLALQHSKEFAGTTSSLTKLLAHIYFLVSGDRKIDISTLSMAFIKESRNFTPTLRLPATFTLHCRRHVSNENADSRSAFDRYATPDAVSAAQFATPTPTQALNPASIIQFTPTDTTFSHAKVAREPISPPNEIENSLETMGDPHSTPRQHVAQSRADGTVIALSLTETAEGPPLVQPDTLPRDSSGCALGAEIDALPPPTVQNLSAPNATRVFDTYALDSSEQDPDSKRDADLNILLWLGTMTEKFLTLSEQEFGTLLRKNPTPKLLPEEAKREVYRYSKSSKFVMRSQLDCQDSRLPGTGVFDIKTRAVLPIRIDQLNYQANSGYQIRKMTGLLESFEREYYDLIRSAFLRYNFQARIGGMDGVFIAYHNTARIFGFQYVPVSEMEERLYGPGPPRRGERVFEKCVGLMEAVVARLVTRFPGKSLSCVADTRQGAGHMLVCATPLKWSSSVRPIVEYRVTVSHAIDDHAVNSQTAVDQAHDNWVMKYKITHSRRSPKQIWKDFFKATQAQAITRPLPEGVSEEEMGERLANVDWAAGLGFDTQPATVTTPDNTQTGKESKGATESATTRFANVSRYLKSLRRLALAGKKDIEREGELAERQILWGRDHDNSTVFTSDMPELPGEQSSVAEDGDYVVEMATGVTADHENYEQQRMMDKTLLPFVVPVRTVDDQDAAYHSLQHMYTSMDRKAQALERADMELNVTPTAQESESSARLVDIGMDREDPLLCWHGPPHGPTGTDGSNEALSPSADHKPQVAGEKVDVAKHSGNKPTKSCDAFAMYHM